MRTPEELRGLVEAFLREPGHWQTDTTPTFADVLQYSLDGGGKRLRPVLCLAVGEALGVEPDGLLAPAVALELVHTFSLVHDDLPALDDDDERRGRASAHVRYGEGVAILAGDALMAKAFRLAGDSGGVLAAAVEAMIEGQYLDITEADVDVLELQRLKTGALFWAAVRIPVEAAGADAEEWDRFSEAFGRLFQLADDLADGDGAVDRYGDVRTRELAADQAALARGALGRVGVDTGVVEALLDELAARAE